MIAGKLATLRDLQTDYGLEDLYDLLEVLQVEAENDARAQAATEVG